MDGHTHSTYSYDGKNTAAELAERALTLGYGYLAITDHCDFDCARLGGFAWSKPLDAPAWYAGLTALQEKYRGKLYLARGVEFGYLKEANGDYADFITAYNPDTVINSVHLTEGEDLYSPDFFAARTRKQAYAAYLKAVRESLDVPYRFDTVGHLGYVARKAPYREPALVPGDSRDLIKDILETIVDKGKALEINSHAGAYDVLPSVEIFKEYRASGGELVTFGSDAHTVGRVGEKLSLATELLKSLGFRYLFVYKEGRPDGIKL
ncbi:MAG: histidinol-phosphatase HisJ family protein [Clostridiaceae bacterium]|jgi:histidinol-phosphatase (PHP family)|nr:histidinol-phosphatase HisJ family protein [Clostridiaceae bacterium]